MMQKRKCAKCGKMFQPTNSQSRYCSPECKVAAQNNNKKHTKKEAKKTVAKKAEPKKVKVVSHEKIQLPAVKKNKPVAKKPVAKKPVAKKDAKPGLPKMPKGCDTMITIHNPKGNHKKVVGLLLAALHKEIMALAK